MAIIWKILGLIIMMFGILALRYAPGTAGQKGEMVKAGLLIGIVTIIIGFILLMFG